MVIYGEYLFAENFITGGILLFFTGKLLRCNIFKSRLVIGAAVCGIAGFVIFLPVSPAVGILIRIVIAGAAVLSGLGDANSLKALLVKASIFMALTFVSGGIVMALMLWQEIPSISGAGALYLPPLSYLRLFCFGMPAFGLSYLLIRLIRRIRMDMRLCDTAEVEIGGKKILLKAMVDTGNYLKEPISGKPVALVAKTAAKKLTELAELTEFAKFAETGEFAGLDEPGELPERGTLGEIEKLHECRGPGSPDSFACYKRYTWIPFRTVGSQGGMLTGIRTDCISFRGNEVKNAVIAFYDGDFEESDMILGRDFLDRGLSDD